jgi:hypothetical protein
MTQDGFAPFVPRVVIVRPTAQATSLDPGSNAVTEESASAASAKSVEKFLSAPDAIDRSDPVEHRDDEAKCCGEARTAASVRERAIKIAGEACARALREAIARNPLFVARFVDDAIDAAGRGSGKTVRLSPVDAAACRGRVAVSVVADEGVAPGEVVVETTHGTVAATIDQRAQVLVRAVADS